jgi:hypothetical protein
MMDRHRQLLGELADMSMALARRFHDAALEAPVEEAQGLILGFQRASRNLRQTLALEARLEREARRAVVEIAAERQARRETRRLQVKSTLSNLIWTERESLDLGRLLLELDGRIDMASLGEAFLDDPVETVIARLRHDLGLPANDAGLEGGGSDPSPPPADGKSACFLPCEAGEGDREAVEGARPSSTDGVNPLRRLRRHHPRSAGEEDRPPPRLSSRFQPQAEDRDP